MHPQTIGPLLAQLCARGLGEDEVRAVARAYDLAAGLWAVNFQSSSRPFLCHAVGTASIVAEFGGRLEAIQAGLLHAAYSSGDFGVRIPGPTRRRRHRVAEVVGSEAEAMVHRFHELLVAHDTRVHEVVADGVEALSDLDREVLFVRVCNDIDDSSDYAFSSATRAVRIREFGEASLAVARALGRADLEARLRETIAAGDAGALPEALRPPHPSGYIAVPGAFRKRWGPAVLEVLHRLRTRGTLRP